MENFLVLVAAVSLCSMCSRNDRMLFAGQCVIYLYIPFQFEDSGTRVIHYTPEDYVPKD